MAGGIRSASPPDLLLRNPAWVMPWAKATRPPDRSLLPKRLIFEGKEREAAPAARG